MKNLNYNKIVHGDCISGMKGIPDKTFDLVIADPPYNLNKNFGEWNEVEKKDQWLSWSKEWIDQVSRLLKDDGNLFIYGIHHHLCWIQCYLYEIGLKYRRQIIWKYENGFAGYKNSLAAHYEPLLWFSKGENYTYNTIREPYKSKERLKHKIIKNGKVWTPNPDGRLAGDVWDFPTLAGRRFKDEKVNHPTQKPISISNRIVNHFSEEDDLVLIPFVGSGTECVASIINNRKFIGYELNKEYINIAEDRIKKAQIDKNLWKESFI